MEGWFKAPATGKFRFYITCDDYCQLDLDSTNPYDEATPPTYKRVKIAYNSGAIDFRDWRRTNSQHRSDWISLVKGKSYSMLGKHVEYTGDDHFTVSVEYEAETPSPTNHHQITKASQTFEIQNDDLPEKWTLTVEKSDGLTYKINIMDETGSKPVNWQSKEIKTNDSTTNFKNAIKDFYKKFGSDIDITRADLDAAGAATTTANLIVKYVYTCSLKRRIKG